MKYFTKGLVEVADPDKKWEKLRYIPFILKIMFTIGQLFGIGIMGLLAGLITRSFANKRHQKQLGTIGLISCMVAAFVGAFMGMYWILAAITALGFIAYIQIKA